MEFGWGMLFISPAATRARTSQRDVPTTKSGHYLILSKIVSGRSFIPTSRWLIGNAIPSMLSVGKQHDCTVAERAFQPDLFLANHALLRRATKPQRKSKPVKPRN
jgi:hypothetical protein